MLPAKTQDLRYPVSLSPYWQPAKWMCGVFWDPTLKFQDYVNSSGLQSGVVCSLNKQVHGTLVQQQQWTQECSQPSVVAFLSSLGSSSYLGASLSVTPFLFSKLVLPEPPYFICGDSPSTPRCSDVPRKREHLSSKNMGELCVHCALCFQRPFSTSLFIFLYFNIVLALHHKHSLVPKAGLF